MTHERTSIKDGKTTYHYSFSALRKFIEHGRKRGNNGMILISRDKRGLITRRGYGTIERPVRYLTRFVMKHNPLFDGPADRMPLEFKVKIIDFSKFPGGNTT